MKTRKISDVPALEQVTETTNVLVEQDGATRRIPAGAVGTKDAVTFTEQKLTEQQQEQARQNIGAAAIDDMLLKKIVGTADDPIVLRNLTKNGTYYLSGKFKHHEADKVATLVEGFYIVKWMKDASYIARHSASDTGIRYYTIHDDSYTAKQFNHADIAVAVERISALEKRVEALDGKVEEYHTSVFYIDGVEYRFERGMTLWDWYYSDYNTVYYLTEYDDSYLTTNELYEQRKGVYLTDNPIKEGDEYTSAMFNEFNHFTVDGTTYYALRNPSWLEWIESDENTANPPISAFDIDNEENGGRPDCEGMSIFDDNNNKQYLRDTIVHGGEYHTAFDSEKEQ